MVSATFHEGTRFGSGFTTPKIRAVASAGRKTGVAAAHGGIVAALFGAWASLFGETGRKALADS